MKKSTIFATRKQNELFENNETTNADVAQLARARDL